MKHSIKKIALIALAVLAVMSLFCVSAFAEDVTVPTTGAVTEPVTTPDATLDTESEPNPLTELLVGLFSGTNLALLGVALAVTLPCLGSAKGVGLVGEAATGLLSEQPSMFGKAFPLMALPMTQGVYGLVASFLMLMSLGLFGDPDNLMNLTFVQGGYFVMAALPIAIAGYLSAIRQGRVAAAGINLIGKRPNSLGQAITTAALVETYAIFALLITIMLVFLCPFSVL